MTTRIFLSSGICLIMNSWIGIWIILELNTLSFCAFTKTFKNIKQKTTEWRIKYFVIQSIASAILVFSSLRRKLTLFEKRFLLVRSISIIAKIAAAPLHQWFVSITTNSNWKIAAILTTWQKLAPIFLIVYQLKTITWMFILTSIVRGATLQINKKKVLEILGLSSVFNLGWIITAILLNGQTFFLFTILYWASVLTLIWITASSNFKDITQEVYKNFPKWVTLIVVSNLAGLPPFPNFVTKIIVLAEGLKNYLITAVTLILVARAVNLFIYLRIFRPLFTKRFTSHQKVNEKSSAFFLVLVIFITFLPLAILRGYKERL